MFKLPLKVVYNQRCKEWHPQSSPAIVDADGSPVAYMNQNVGHPGEYDADAVAAAETMVACVNRLQKFDVKFVSL